MYCLQCRMEYRDGFTTCSDCQVDLVPVLAPESELTEVPDSTAEPMLIFESIDRFAISLAKGDLEDADIPFWLQGRETDTRLVGAALIPFCRFLVPPDREAEARELMGPLELPVENLEPLAGPDQFEGYRSK